MKKVFKNLFYQLVPVLILLFFIFAYNVIKLNFQHGFQTSNIYQTPYSWQKYILFSELKEFIKKINENRNFTNFPKVKIYLEEKSKKKLLGNLPRSSKLWVDALITFPEKNISMKEIKIRYRGDNPDNWLKIKKTFRIKTKKNELINGFRNFDYYIFSPRTFFPYLISNQMGLLGQKFRLVEVYINGISHGLFYELEKIDESFLRKNKIMPVNVYKGENTALEFHLGLNPNLFNNPGLWTKEAVFNDDPTSKKDLLRFLTDLKSNTFLDDPSLNRFVDVDEFAKFDAFLTLTGNDHHDYYHNLRLILDPWNGKVTQIIADPIIESHKNIMLDFGANDLGIFLNKNTSFVHEKYKHLYNYLSNQNIIENTISYYDKIKKELAIIERKEPYDPRFNGHINESEKYLNKLKNNKSKILEILNSKTNSSWYIDNTGFEINIDDFTPLSNIKIHFNSKNYPKWVGIDINYDNSISDNEPKFYLRNNSDSINLPIAIYSNRFKKDNYNNFSNSYQISHSKTYFKLLTENNIMPIKLESSNFFNKHVHEIELKKSYDSVKKNISNNIIYLNETQKLDETQKKNTILSGQILVTKNLNFKDKVIIEPNTQFLISSGKNIIFQNQVLMNGTKENPIVFNKIDELSDAWGSVALIGSQTENSKINNVRMYGGSGGNFKQFKFTSMFSLHDTQNINITNSEFSFNEKYDDTIHIIYCKNILLKNLIIKHAYSDAIDVDISEDIIFNNIKIDSPNNDGIDFMESTSQINNLEVINSNDKGISIGENSNIYIKESKFYNNKIGIAVKDASKAKVYSSNLVNNKTQIATYAKNWRYGKGGKIQIYNSEFKSDLNSFVTSMDPEDLEKNINDKLNQESQINLFNTKILGEKKIIGKNFISN